MSNIDKHALRSKARSASAGEWIKESGDGWEAICSANDQANGNFIIAHFEGPDAQVNREFMQAANPHVVLALLDELKAKDQRIAELSHHLQSAHAFVEHTEAFGHAASNGILCCGDAQWNIDESKSALAAAGKGE
ncbi:ead/Ea22-like family protein [Enterobacter hormaechei]|uniref:ead/Ea22-like family protein n=1 Tax=Enterobacter hormaechei TaxID=158836 RepID=UPI00079BD712|nr:ead/Ea22-like family protein [Enterobacter hormaechei]MCM8155464.1 ead/Ea22-like family protein [Enterobacter hormaechei]MCV3636658.1 ead/Ea22-like family protein [Enterobacter hormaechei]MDV5282073.1 ead/Ea22-like family protein [Enterobacter hormaechei]MDV5314428.1 ead/Ea22-like family protein [Enterobacter hormaechei]MDV5380713.1 ead/Ea22-like family protein [Enterobacter hormaechei]